MRFNSLFKVLIPQLTEPIDQEDGWAPE